MKNDFFQARVLSVSTVQWLEVCTLAALTVCTPSYLYVLPSSLCVSQYQVPSQSLSSTSSQQYHLYYQHREDSVWTHHTLCQPEND